MAEAKLLYFSDGITRREEREKVREKLTPPPSPAQIPHIANVRPLFQIVGDPTETGEKLISPQYEKAVAAWLAYLEIVRDPEAVEAEKELLEADAKASAQELTPQEQVSLYDFVSEIVGDRSDRIETLIKEGKE